MRRTVIGAKDIQRQRELVPIEEVPAEADDYKSRLLKYIPSEVIALYLTLDALIRASGESSSVLFWLIFIVGVVAVPLYLWRIEKVEKPVQLAISTVAFIVWVFAIGGPFTLLSWYKPVYGAIALPIYTFAIPLVEA